MTRKTGLLAIALLLTVCPLASAQEGTLLYVPNGVGDSVAVFSRNADGTLAPVTTITGPGLNSPEQVAVRADQAFAYVTVNIDNVVQVVDTRTNGVVQTVTGLTGPRGVAVSPDGSRVYVANNTGGTNTVSAYSADPLTGQLTALATISTGVNTQPRRVVVSPDGSRLYIANQGNLGANGSISVVDTSTNTIVATVATGGQLTDIAVNAAGTRVYVVSTTNQMFVVDTATNTVVATVATGGDARGVVVHPDGTRVYVTNQNTNTINQFDAATNASLGVVPSLGTTPFGVVVSPNGTSVYTANNISSNVSMFSVTAGTGLLAGMGTVAVGTSPTYPGICGGNGNLLLATGRTFVANSGGALGCTGTVVPTFTGGTLRVNNAGLSFASPITLGVAGGTIDTNANDATFSGVFSGPGNLTKSGAGTLTLNSANTYGGTTTVSAGTLQAASAGAFPASSALTIAAGATLDLQGADQAIASLAGAGAVTLSSGTLTTGGDDTSTTYSGSMSGAGGLAKVGAGVFTLTGVHTYGGPTTVAAGTLVVAAGSLVPTPTTVSGGTLAGAGTVAGAMLTGGTIRPTSIFTVAGNLNIGSGASLTTAINGPSPSTDFGQVRVAGTVTLAGALNVTVSSMFAAGGASLILIDNDGADAVAGTFAGLPEGATVVAGGATFRISYVGGDGNDVTLGGLFLTYLAEGAGGPFFGTRIAMLNTNPTVTAIVTMQFLTSTGSTFTYVLSIAPLGRETVTPGQAVPALAGANFSTVIDSNTRVVADRTMTWTAARYGSHAETGADAPLTAWYFAEGATHGQFDLFYLLENATATAADVEITYLLPSGPLAPRTYHVPARTRSTIYVDQEAELDATDVSAIVRVTNGVPISAERAMYLSTPEQAFAAGTAVKGVAAPSTQWLFAEGATGSFFDLYLLLANPQPTAADVDVTYTTSAGDTLTRPYTIAANSRRTISVEQEDPLLAGAAISATVTSTNGVPIVAERAMYWPAFPWYEGHASAGATATGTLWALAEGEAGGPDNAQTYILILNAGASAATVRVTLPLQFGGPPLQRDYTIPPHSRFSIDAGADFPGAVDHLFGALVESLGATPQPIVVERSMYTTADGVLWSGGTNVVGTRLR